MLGNAIALAALKFESVTDKSGQPYMLHCLYVMYQVDQKDEELMCIAVLHDIIEDTDITQFDLHKMGFTDRVINAVITLTHNKEDSYDTYVKKISLNPDAVKVKRADLKHNSDITRLKGLAKEDMDRTEKYHRAFVYLSKV